MISTYISVLASDGVVGLIKALFFLPSEGLTNLVAENEGQVFMIMRVVFFFLGMVWLVSKGGFKISVGQYHHWSGRTIIHMIFSLLSTLLFLCTVLILLSGFSVFGGNIVEQGMEMYKESQILKGLIEYYQIWFSLPAVAFLFSSHFLDESEA